MIATATLRDKRARRYTFDTLEPGMNVSFDLVCNEHSGKLPAENRAKLADWRRWSS